VETRTLKSGDLKKLAALRAREIEYYILFWLDPICVGGCQPRASYGLAIAVPGSGAGNPCMRATQCPRCPAGSPSSIPGRTCRECDTDDFERHGVRKSLNIPKVTLMET